MSSTPGPEHLSSHHRDTLVQIFQDKTNHNVEWHDVMSLLEAIGSIETDTTTCLCSASDKRRGSQAPERQGRRRTTTRRLALDSENGQWRGSGLKSGTCESSTPPTGFRWSFSCDW
jgi:hypothetical protein